MLRYIVAFVIQMLMVCTFVVSADAREVRALKIALELDLSRSNDLKARVVEGGYEIETIGDDPFVMCKPIAGEYDPDKQFIFSFEYLSIKGVSSIQLYYGPPIRAGHAAEGQALLSSEGWTMMGDLSQRICVSLKGGDNLLRFLSSRCRRYEAHHQQGSLFTCNVAYLERLIATASTCIIFANLFN